MHVPTCHVNDVSSNHQQMLFSHREQFYLNQPSNRRIKEIFLPVTIKQLWCMWCFFITSVPYLYLYSQPTSHSTLLHRHYLNDIFQWRELELVCQTDLLHVHAVHNNIPHPRLLLFAFPGRSGDNGSQINSNPYNYPTNTLPPAAMFTRPATFLSPHSQIRNLQRAENSVCGHSYTTTLCTGQVCCQRFHYTGTTTIERA